MRCRREIRFEKRVKRPPKTDDRFAAIVVRSTRARRIVVRVYTTVNVVHVFFFAYGHMCGRTKDANKQPEFEHTYDDGR